MKALTTDTIFNAIIEPAGVSIGVAGILLTFTGVVDTVNLFDLIVSRDNGSHYLALKYEIEKRKLVLWRNEHRVEEKKSSPLLQESRSTRILIASILAEMKAAHERAGNASHQKRLNQLKPGRAEMSGDCA